jgi:deazaflavin-dependent oxidoreductase (nitroreductase family)
MSGTWDNVDYSLLGDDHVAAYRESDGEVGYIWNGAPTVLLTTTGRKSGEARTSALIYGRDGDDFVLVASVGGMPKHPAWYLNLKANPRAHIQERGDHYDVEAREAEGEEKARLWAMMQAIWPNYDTYQSRTERVIPVLVLSPVAS